MVQIYADDYHHHHRNNKNNHFFRENTIPMTTTTTSTAKNHHHTGFSSVPTFNLKWGSQRHLRCVKHPEFLSPSTSASPFRRRRRSPSSDDDDDEGIEAVTEKLILDFRAKVDELQSAFLNGRRPHSAAAATTSVAAAATAESRPWKLRSNLNGHVCSPARNSDEGVGEEKGKRRKFSVSLSKQEIERDFVAMTGSRPAKRPKKRAKAVQKQINALFPGFWLTEITADMYKVNEEPPDALKRL